MHHTPHTITNNFHSKFEYANSIVFEYSIALTTQGRSMTNRQIQCKQETNM